MAGFTNILCCFSVLAFITPANGNAFLSRTSQSSHREVSASFAQMLLNEIETVLGSEHRSFTEKRLDRIQEDLRPIWDSLPKNRYGRLEHEAVTYTLHRVFVQRHGWLMRGFSPTDQGTAPSATQIFEDRVPDYVVQLFEKRMGNHGTNMHDLAIMVATIEHLIHKEAMVRLRVAYEAHSFTSEDVVSPEEADLIFDSYMTVYILGFLVSDSVNNLTPSKVKQLRDNIEQVYPTWNETQAFFREVKNKVAPKRDYLYFADVANVIEEAGEKYGSWQDQECQKVQADLIALEDPKAKGSGRVLLADFYKAALQDGDWQFSESSAYLRDLGAIDDSDPNRPRLLIANYMTGPSNCVASSTYYAVCCRDACEAKLGHFEKKVKSPEASVPELLALASEVGNFTLTPWLKRRLEDVGEHHNGRVPLHGRLFAQWMHFAYPRECAYPHLAGTTSHVDVQAFLNDTVNQFTATQEDMLQFAMPHPESKKSAPNLQDSEDEPCMWTMAEEILGKQHTPSNAGHSESLGFMIFGGNVAVVGLLVSIVFGMFRSRGKSAEQKLAAKFYV